MAKYVLVYKGGEMGATPEEQEKMMADWMGWFGSLGAAVLDPGNPFGPAATLSPDGKVGDGAASGLGGYSIIEAGSLSEATTKARGCPVLTGGGTVEIYEGMPIG
ncbi:MAG TPA: hypothetical protein VE990_19450 [Acidimicrobiales bacterium]|nr:hypothetical protein [Acidimicrobiales bacterium]